MKNYREFSINYLLNPTFANTVGQYTSNSKLTVKDEPLYNWKRDLENVVHNLSDTVGDVIEMPYCRGDKYWNDTYNELREDIIENEELQQAIITLEYYLGIPIMPIMPESVYTKAVNKFYLLKNEIFEENLVDKDMNIKHLGQCYTLSLNDAVCVECLQELTKEYAIEYAA